MEGMVVKLKGQNILVTGGDGLVGSHLIEDLLKLRSNIYITYRSLNPKSYFSTKNLHQSVVIATADIKDYFRIFDIVTKYEIDYIFHLAAQPIVDTAYYNPRETYETNILGTVNILESARQYERIKGVLIASSDKAYGKLDKKYIETDPLKGDHPYEASKASCDLIAQSYFQTYKLPVVITRFGNVYGPGDLNFNRLVPGIMYSTINNEVLKVRSDGNYTRDYIYVKDVVCGCLKLIENINTTKGHAFNISSNDTYSVKQLIQKIESILGSKVKYKIINSAKNEIPYQSLSYEKIAEAVNYKPRYSIDKAVLETFSWYAKNFNLKE